jgi:methionyl-tRNA formyltransferase
MTYATDNRSHMRTRPRVLFAGMRGEFSRLALVGLLEAGVDVCAVWVAEESRVSIGAPPPAIRPGKPPSVRRSTLPVLTPFHTPSIVTVAWERGIPVLEVARERDPQVAAALAAYEPDVACVACWPRRLPEALLAVPRHGWLNLHPSLLPAHRGPAPLFWTVRAGDARAGVTVHVIDASLDGGDIVAQSAVDLPDGISGDEMERRCAMMGGQVMAQAALALAAGMAIPQPQPTGEGSYEPWPTADDFAITPDRPARWAFNFLRAAPYWGETPMIDVAGRRFVVTEAVDFDATRELDEPFRREGTDVWLRCAPGVLHVHATATPSPARGPV